MKKMKKYKLINKLMIVLYVLFAIYYGFSWYKVRIIYGGKEHQESSLKTYSLCEEYSAANESQKLELTNKYGDLYGIEEEYCNETLSYGVTDHSAYNLFQNFLTNEKYMFPFFIPVIVILPFVYTLSKEFRNKMVKTYCLRKDYKSYKNHIFITAYKNIFVIPITIFITFLIAYILSHGNMNPAADIGFNLLLPNITFLDNPLFIPFYILTLFLGMGLFINIALIVLRKNKNFIVAIIESELFVYLTWGFTSIALGLFADRVLGISPDNFNLLSIYNWVAVDNIYLYFGLNLVLFILTFVIARLVYKDKEEFITMCEQ